jgi:hypothetical protein
MHVPGRIGSLGLLSLVLDKVARHLPASRRFQCAPVRHRRKGLQATQQDHSTDS